MLPFVAEPAGDEELIPDGFVDYAGVEALRLEPGVIPAMAMVTRAVSPGSNEAKNTPAAQQALRAALQLLRDKEVLPSYDTATEWAQAKAAYPDARVVRAHAILGVKHAESTAESKWKARIVAGGNNVRDSWGQHVVDVMETAAPVSLEGIRCVLAISFATGGDVRQLDVEAAYLHAPLTGHQYFVELPQSLWPTAWVERNFRRPVLPLLKAVPGLTQSGCLWHTFADEAAESTLPIIL